MSYTGWLVALALLPNQATPQDSSAARLPAELAACRQISDERERLACFDQASERLASAIANGDILVLDREKRREARREMFGFSLPSLGKIFGESSSEERDDRMQELEAIVDRSYQDGSGNLVIVLEDGAEWQQTTGRPPVRNPRKGQKVMIKRAALGSFFASVEGGLSLRVRRVK